MRRNHRPDWTVPRVSCPECGDSLHCDSPSNLTCRNCRRSLTLLRCFRSTCNFQSPMCTTCDLENFEQRIINAVPQRADAFKAYQVKDKTLICLTLFLLLTLVVAYIYWNSSSESRGDSIDASVMKLRAHYRAQKNETWYHFMSVLEKKTPSVKSITLLHRGDKTTCNCLTSEIVTLYTGNREIKMEDITFSTFGPEVKDYGFSLEHYRTVVERFRVLVTDLTKVSGNIARIFHSLCDEVSSDIKPSLFIFTLKHDKGSESLKPIERAGITLREAWSNLPQSEISPLLSRILKNVVDIVPESQANC